MSGVYAYCVLRGGTAPPAGLTGLDATAVRAHEVDGVTVWLSDADVRPEPDVERIRRHHEVVSAAAEEGVVPLRFGAWAASASELDDRIREMRERLEDAMSRLEGRLEFGLRIQSTCPPPAPEASDGRADASSGSAYLRALSRRREQRAGWRRRQEDAIRRVRETLGEVVLEERIQYLSPPELATLAHLVRRQDESVYRGRAALIAAESGGDHVVHVTGPWPPYTFSVS